MSLVPVSPRDPEPLSSLGACPRSVSQAHRVARSVSQAGRAGGAAPPPPQRRRQSPLLRWQEARRRGRRQASAAAVRPACLPGQSSSPPSVPASSSACPASEASLAVLWGASLPGACLPTTVSLAVPRAAPQEAAATVLSASFLPVLRLAAFLLGARGGAGDPRVSPPRAILRGHQVLRVPGRVRVRTRCVGSVDKWQCDQ